MSPRRAAATLAALVVVVLALNLSLGRALDRLRPGLLAWDMTAEGSASLSEETLRVLDRVDRRLEITAFFPRDAIGRVEAATLLSRYRDANRKITYKVLDPVLAPGEAQRLGVEGSGSAAVVDIEDPSSTEIAGYTIEIDVTSAIARLLREVQGTICFTRGHGERSIDDASPEGLTQAAELLRSNGYDIEEIDLLTKEKVPEECDAVVVASPEVELASGFSEALSKHLESSGRAVLFADPASEVDISGVSEAWGITFERGVVVEGDPAGHLAGDLTSPVITRYAGGSPVVRGVGPTFFPRSLAVRTTEVDDPGTTATEIAVTSRLGYLDVEDVTSFDEDVDKEGPVAVGAASDSSEVADPTSPEARIERTRLLAWGDVDFASNAFIEDGSNARLFLQGIDWLTQPEDLITAVPSFPGLRELELTEARNRYILFLTAGVVPGLFVLAGAFVWVLRRSR